MEDRHAKRIKDTVRKAYGERWESGAGCCQPSEAESARTTCESCGDSRRDAASPSPAHRRMMEELAPRDGMKVLDVGSGSGETVLLIAEKVAPTGIAVGIDFSEEAIALAKRNAQGAGLGKVAEFRLGDAENLPFDDGTFDAVLSECVVCLVPDKQRAINEKARVLKPGGRVIMHDVVSFFEMPAAMRGDSGLYCACIGGAIGVQDYKDMMEKAGLKDIEVIDFTKDVRAGLNASILPMAMNIKDDEQFAQVIDFVRKGGIGYVLLIGRKPEVDS